jgi:small conductance mechanosensitive channel
LRVLVIRALTRAGIITAADAQAVGVGAIVHPATASGAEGVTQGPEK